MIILNYLLNFNRKVQKLLNAKCLIRLLLITYFILVPYTLLSIWYFFVTLRGTAEYMEAKRGICQDWLHNRSVL